MSGRLCTGSACRQKASSFTRGVLKRLVILGLLYWSWPLLAQEANLFPAEEIGRTPTPARITALVDRAAGQGWGSVAPALRAAIRLTIYAAQQLNFFTSLPKERAASLMPSLSVR